MKTWIIYLAHIIIFSNTIAEQIAHVNKNLYRLKDAIEALKMKSSKFFKSQLRFFPGLCNVYCRFVDSFAHKADSLLILLQKNASDHVTIIEAQTKSFGKLILAILSPPALALLQLRVTYFVDTEASAYGFQCSLHRTTFDGECQTFA